MEPRDHGHIAFQCRCGESVCPYCAGGLFNCIRCGAAEGQLPTDCPGVKMTETQKDETFIGALDFKDDRWVSGADSPRGW